MPGAPTALGFGAALVLAGLGFGSPSLLVPGFGLLALTAIAVSWVELARPRRLLRERGPARVVEGEPFTLRIEAVGAPLPPPGGSLCDSTLDAPLEVGPRWSGRLDAEVRVTGRGRHRLVPARLQIRDPLGLRIREIAGDEPGDLLVLPRIEPVTAGGAGGGGWRSRTNAGLEEGGTDGQFEARAIEVEVDGLRAYREGSPASRIHWPAVARTGELVERRLVAGSDTAPLVVLDASRPASAEALDAAVRAAASLCRHLAEKSGAAILLPGDRRATEVEPDLRAWAQVHARLALVEAASGPPPLARALRPGAVFWVTARPRPALPAALRGGGPRYLVAPLVEGRGAPAFEVAGCQGRRLGSRSRGRGPGRLERVA